MELKTLLSGQDRDTKVTWEGEEVLVTYDPTAYTPKLEAEVYEAIDKGGGESRVLVGLMAKMLKGWDVTQEGEPFPPTEENLNTLPVMFLARVFIVIGKEIGADPLLRGDSDEPS